MAAASAMAHRRRVQEVRERIAAAARRAGRDPAAVELVAVSKTKPVADILSVYDAGLRAFGENRTEEFEAKALAITGRPDLRWHFIGHLQTRRSLAVAQHAHWFHAVDRLKIAQRLSGQLDDLGRRLKVFVQVNVSGEASKGGFICNDWQHAPGQLPALTDAVLAVSELPHLELAGLMTMAPLGAEGPRLREIFNRMKQLSVRLNEDLPMLNAPALSMGMSGDYEIAVAAGATHVRIGTAIFGPRT
jgi:hypothetical protein